MIKIISNYFSKDAKNMKLKWEDQKFLTESIFIVQLKKI